MIKYNFKNVQSKCGCDLNVIYRHLHKNMTSLGKHKFTIYFIDNFHNYPFSTLNTFNFFYFK